TTGRTATHDGAPVVTVPGLAIVQFRRNRRRQVRGLGIAGEVAVAIARRVVAVNAEAVDRTTRLHQQIAANAPFVAQLIRAEELQAVTTIVRKVAIGTDHQLGIVEVLRGAGIGLTDVRLHAAFGVALALRVGVRTLQEQPVPVALEEELQRAVGALRLRTHLERARGDVELVAFLPDLVRTDGNGLDRAVAI